MSNNTDTVRVYFPADIPRDQVDLLVSTLTGTDTDVCLAIENAVNNKVRHAAGYDPDFDFTVFDAAKVEVDAPIVLRYGVARNEYDLLEDVTDEVTA